jgi:hypothetical protein
MKKALIILILFVTVDTAFACKCLQLTFEQEAQSSTSIFHGRVISIDHYTYDIEIIQVWKEEFSNKIFQLKQGETSCETRTFELNKEYLFYLSGKSVFNCSRTQEYQLTLDSELLDLKFKNIGDKQSIESSSFTDKEIDILKPLLKRRNVNLDDIGNQQVLFAIQDKWVDKWAFINSLNWLSFGIKLNKLDSEKNPVPMILWTGSNWNKSIKRLKKSL